MRAWIAGMVTRMFLQLTMWMGRMRSPLAVAAPANPVDPQMLKTLFGCLYANGFIVESAGRGKWVYEPDSFVSEHFTLLCAERVGVVPGIRDMQRGRLLDQEIAKHAAATLNEAALVVALRMAEHKNECREMVKEIMQNSDFRDHKLLLIATNVVDMKWLRDEILEYFDDDTCDILYVLMLKYLKRGSEALRKTISMMIRERRPRETYGDVARLFLDLKDTSRANVIDNLQKTFGLINSDSIGYFINEDMLFAVERFEQDLKKAIARHRWGKIQVIFVIQSFNNTMLEAVPVSMLKECLKDMLGIQKNVMDLVPAVDFVRRVVERCDVRSIWEMAGPLIPRFLLRLDANDVREIRSFLIDNPEFVRSTPLVKWIATSDENLVNVLEIFLERRRMLGENYADNPCFLNNLSKDMLKKLKGTGIFIGVDINNISKLQEMCKQTMVDKSVFRVIRYELDLIKMIVSLKEWTLLQTFASRVHNKDVIDACVMASSRDVVESYVRYVCKHSNVVDIERLRGKGVVNREHLHLACAAGNLAVAKHLMEKGIKPYTMWIYRLCRDGDVGAIKCIVEAGEVPCGWWAMAARIGNQARVVQYLHELGVASNNEGLVKMCKH